MEKSLRLTAHGVLAILGGRKTQIRLPLNPQPPEDVGTIRGPEFYTSIAVDKFGEEIPGSEAWGVYSEIGDWGRKCPWQPGDRLWVKETWKLVPATAYRASREDDGSMVPHQESPDGNSWAVYKAGWTRSAPRPWKSSTQMPKWASRITVEILGVRIERMQDITVDDALAEGIPADACRSCIAQYDEPCCIGKDGVCGIRESRITEFAEAWDSINAQRACWDSNPWVWVLDLKMVSTSSEENKTSSNAAKKEDK